MGVPRKWTAMLSVISLTGALLSLASGEPADPQVSTVVYPPAVMPLHFSHSLHVGKLGTDCEQCHGKVRESASALDNNLPREADCKACHDIDRKNFDKASGAGQAPTQCSACHVGFDRQSGFVPRARLPIPNLKFSHKSHLSRQTPCSACHGEAITGRVAGDRLGPLPTMRACLTCHDGKQADDACTSCHISQAGGVVKTQFAGLGSLIPSGVLRGAAHDMKFRESHKFAAQNDQRFCASCHKKEFCVDCHNGVTKPMDFHAGDYIAMHTIDARRNAPDCSSCHRIQTFCQGCHSRMGVAADNKGSEFGPAPGKQYHPPGWIASGLTPAPASHSFEAQRNIKQCVSCHRENFCTGCHSAQPANLIRISPHPRDWRGSRRCQALIKRNKRMCLRCHTEARALDCFQ